MKLFNCDHKFMQNMELSCASQSLDEFNILSALGAIRKSENFIDRKVSLYLSHVMDL